MTCTLGGGATSASGKNATVVVASKVPGVSAVSYASSVIGAFPGATDRMSATKASVMPKRIVSRHVMLLILGYSHKGSKEPLDVRCIQNTMPLACNISQARGIVFCMHRTSRGSLLPLCEYPKINNMTWRETILLGITLAFVALILSVAPGKAPITEDAYETAETPGTFEATTTVAFFPEAEVAPPPKVQVIHTPEPAEQIPVVQQAPPPPADNEESSGVSRLENPYPFAPLPEETLNANARAALIHILCIVNGDQSVSGSGVLIDARGVVLTNAHVGQFVLLSEVSSNITCTARTGTPAKAAWKMRTLYMPST